MQSPEGPSLTIRRIVRGPKVHRAYQIKESDRQYVTIERIEDQYLGIRFSDCCLPQAVDAALKTQHSLLVPVYGSRNLAAKIQASGMPSTKRDQIPGKHQVVADEHPKPHRDLKRHALVVCGSEADRRGEFPGLPPGEINDSEEKRAIPLHSIGLGPDGERSALQFLLERVDQLAVMNRFPRLGSYRCFNPTKRFAIYANRSAMRDQGSDHSALSSLAVNSCDLRP